MCHWEKKIFGNKLFLLFFFLQNMETFANHVSANKFFLLKMRASNFHTKKPISFAAEGEGSEGV